VWQARVGEGYASPAISNGRLFQFDRFGNQARLDCLNSETGKKLWQFEYATNYEDLYGYNNGPRCQPVVDHERVYTFGAEGMLHCLHVETGQVIWKVDTAADFGVIQNFFGVGSTPVVEGNLLIANIGGSPAEDRAIPPGRLDRVSSNGSAIVAFDKLTGKVVYKLGDDLASYSSPRIATIGGRRWGFVFARNGLLGFEPASGKLDFFFPWRATILESVNASSPVVVDDLVFISETYGPGSALLRVKPGGYDVVWQDELRSRDKKMQSHWNTAVHHQGYLYASSGRHKENAELRCIELKTGRVMWSQPDLTRCSLLYADGHLICLAEVGDLLVLKATPEKFDVVSHVVVRAHDAATGASPRLLKYPSWAAPILSHGLLYVRGPDWLVCLEAIPEK
jgi:outer membrane protein assembly factor BamB